MRVGAVPTGAAPKSTRTAFLLLRRVDAPREDLDFAVLGLLARGEKEAREETFDRD